MVAYVCPSVRDKLCDDPLLPAEDLFMHKTMIKQLPYMSAIIHRAVSTEHCHGTVMNLDRSLGTIKL